MVYIEEPCRWPARTDRNGIFSGERDLEEIWEVILQSVRLVFIAPISQMYSLLSNEEPYY